MKEENIIKKIFLADFKKLCYNFNRKKYKGEIKFNGKII